MSTIVHPCGGIVRSGAFNTDAHAYCDKCGAFKFDDVGGEFPTGIDPDANERAWDLGEGRSPEAPEFPPEERAEEGEEPAPETMTAEERAEVALRACTKLFWAYAHAADTGNVDWGMVDEAHELARRAHLAKVGGGR